MKASFQDFVKIRMGIPQKANRRAKQKILGISKLASELIRAGCCAPKYPFDDSKSICIRLRNFQKI
jgi:hypothetical protein